MSHTDRFDHDAFRELAEHTSDGPHVSMYLPMVVSGVETQQNPIRFKNALRDVRAGLEAKGISSRDADALLEPALARIDDFEFWQHQADGLAVFMAEGVYREYRLPRDFHELVMVEHRFHLKPVFPLLAGDGRFYVLALAKNSVRLLEGTRYRVQEIALEDAPESLADALGSDLTEQHLDFRTPQQGQAIFHAQGAGNDDEKPELRKFFALLDQGLEEQLGDRHTPLVLAGVDYLLPIYRDASRYPAIVEEGISGNPEDLPAATLHEKAWAIVGPHFDRARLDKVEQFHVNIGDGRASHQLDEVLLAAVDGRIDTLFVPIGVRQWGRFDESARTVERVDAQEPGTEDLFDLAAVRTVLNGGDVFAVEPEDVPGDGRVAAVFRY